MLVISIPSADLCLYQKIEEIVNGRVIFEIVVVKRCASFYRIDDRKMFWPRMPLIIDRFGHGFHNRKVDHFIGKRINVFLTNLYCPFSQHERF